MDNAVSIPEPLRELVEDSRQISALQWHIIMRSWSIDRKYFLVKFRQRSLEERMQFLAKLDAEKDSILFDPSMQPFLACLTLPDEDLDAIIDLFDSETKTLLSFINKS